MTLWICGIVPDCSKKHEWGLVGIFDTREKAAALCEDCRMFISPMQLNVAEDSGEARDFPAVEFPNKSRPVVGEPATAGA